MRQWAVQLTLLLLAVWSGLLWSSRSEAELDPYYVMRGVGFASAKPRVLFVVDTSGSMTWRADAYNRMCDYRDCEHGEGDELSRIAAARRAIRSVIDQSIEVAEFSLMTFGQKQPPSSKGHIPSTTPCGGARFRWNTWYTDWWNGWKETTLYGSPGVWNLCDTNLPYPYIRWDYLGRGSVITADDQTGPVPDSPLIATDYANFSHWENAYRPVQWFPRFMGVRTNLNPVTDPDQSVLDDTWGDYGTKSSERLAYIWEQDFYYWPYVDGFPGYSFQDGWNPYDGSVQDLGIASQPSYSGASLYAPFFLPEIHDQLNPNAWGPSTKEEATNMVLSFTGPMHEGGVDADGGTPWASTIGPIVASPPRSNAIFSHSTVASYLAFAKNGAPSNICVPLTTVLLTDGDPSPSNEGGSLLHRRLAALRNDLGSKVYVVGFVHSSTSLNNMACAAAGSNNSSSPCYGTPTKDWDTCFNPSNPSGECAFLADDPESLAATLTQIVTGAIELSLSAGTSHSVNEFGVNQEKQYGSEEGTVQTTVSAVTEWPSWRGHVQRAACKNIDPETGELEDYCNALEFEESFPTFGPCGASRVWDAGECLQQTEWDERRIYTHDVNHTLVPISDDSGRATPLFIAQLNSVDLDLPGAPYDQESANELVEFILGRHHPEGWKLPGVAQSAPIVIRRVAKKNTNYSPTVGIRDPHCAGRRLSQNLSIPKSLEDFSDAVWATTLESPQSHLEYQEGVLVGDDLGMLHSFQLDSGNEMWGLLPRTMLYKMVEAAANGPELMGQTKHADDHIYGLGGTVNHGWVFDPDLGHDGDWRHLAVIGAAKGGDDFLVLDVSHMSPSSPRGPVEILWTTKDAALAEQFQHKLGQTWARAALSYHIPGDEVSQEPSAILILSSGYKKSDLASDEEGKVIMLVDALSGELLDEAVLPDPTRTPFESNFANIVDPAVSTHCSSRFWAEAQEVYFPDPAGRLYRWDIAHETEHAGDSGQRWDGEAIPVATFIACQGEDDFGCEVRENNKADPFHYSAAVVSHNRIDELSGAPSGVLDESYRNNFLVALNSGSLYESALDPSVADLHASLYVMADDHREEGHEGFDIPELTPKMGENMHATYRREAFTDIVRVRRYQPVADGDWYEEERAFSRKAMPVRAPRIIVQRGFTTDEGGNFEDWLPQTEFVYIEYTVYEGPSGVCSPEWYDSEAGEWVYDEGSAYVVRGRLVAEDGKPFNFLYNETVNPDKYGFTNKTGLQFQPPVQIMTGDCADGSCSAQEDDEKLEPCDPNSDPPMGTRATSVRLGFQQLSGFSPIEIPR